MQPLQSAESQVQIWLWRDYERWKRTEKRFEFMNKNMNIQHSTNKSSTCENSARQFSKLGRNVCLFSTEAVVGNLKVKGMGDNL